MKKLLVQQNQVTYAAQFAKPVFALWGDGQRTLEGLFTAFNKRGITLANFRFDQSSQDPAAQALVVSFSPSYFYRFHLDHVESILNNFRSDDLIVFPEVLSEGAEWLRSSIPDFSFHSHLFTYFGHAKLSEGSSHDVLAAIPTFCIPEIGTSEGNGIIFHWRLPERGWKTQLLLDHSLTVPNGLFIQFLLFIMENSINYVETAKVGRNVVDVALKQIGLEIDDGN